MAGITTEKRYRAVKSGKVKLLNGGETNLPPFVINGDFTDDAFIVDFVRVYDRREETK